MPFCSRVIEQNVITRRLDRYISTCDLCGGNLRFQGNVGQLWNGLVLRILKVVSYFLWAFLSGVIEQNVITRKLACCISTCDLCGVNLRFQGHVGIFGMVWSRGFLKRFHISCGPFRSRLIEQNVIANATPLCVSTCDLVALI